MTRGCSIPDCQRAPAKKSVCCGQKLCSEHEVGHACPRAAELLAMTPDQVRQWKRENAPEERLTSQLRDALNKLPGVRMRVTKRKQGSQRSDDLDGVLDLSGHAAPDGIAIYVETKRTDPDDCLCSSCKAQRAFAARAEADGCVVVTGVRSVQEGVDGVRMGIAKARARAAMVG